MAKLRHIALAVPDIQATARFYESSFGMQRVRESDHAVKFRFVTDLAPPRMIAVLFPPACVAPGRLEVPLRVGG